MRTLAYEQHAQLEERHWWFRGRRTVCAGLLREELERDVPRRVLDLMVQLVDWQASRRPTVLVAEDLHWCDSATLSLLDELLRRLSHRPLLIVGFTRPEFAQEHPELAEGRQRQRIELIQHDIALKTPQPIHNSRAEEDDKATQDEDP